MMHPNDARKRAREIYKDADKSCADYTIRTMILRKLVAEGADPVHAATAAGFDVSMTTPPWLADLVNNRGEGD